MIPGTIAEFEYLTWNYTRWKARIHRDGTFTHTDEFGNSHEEKYILYISDINLKWKASMRFTNGPISVVPTFFHENGDDNHESSMIRFIDWNVVTQWECFVNWNSIHDPILTLNVKIIGSYKP